ncbi:MAG: hypothetical protein AAF705_16270 [Bacteroidota bacterium]
MGVLGWSDDQFWKASPKATIYAIQGYYENQQAIQKEQWIRAQFIAWYSVAPYLEKKNQEKVRKQIFFFQEENKPKGKKLNEAQKQFLFGDWDRIMKQKYAKENNGTS